MPISDWYSFSSGITASSCNFAAKNLGGEKGKTPEAVKSLIALLERGAPSKPSHMLLDRVKAVSSCEITDEMLSLSEYYVGDEELIWKDVILGDDKRQYYPAREFHSRILDEHLPEFSFIRSLMLPECPIGWIVDGVEQTSKLSAAERVDFYLPEARLVIEIDGQSHKKQSQKTRDQVRDLILKQTSVKVVRIQTSQIRDGGNGLKDALRPLQRQLEAHNDVLSQCKAFLDGKSYNKKNSLFDLIAISRLQRLTVELIRRGRLPLNSTSWDIEIVSDFNASMPWARLAFDDLQGNLEAFAVVYDEDIKLPDISILDTSKTSSKRPDVRIDLSVFKRFDESCDAADVVYVRNHFIQSYPKPVGGKQCDFGANLDRVEKDSSVRLTGEKSENALAHLAQRVFGYENFQLGQLDVIQTHFQNRSTLGLLPTGAGKSFCFQISNLVRRGCTLVICPITALVRDHVAELEKFGFRGRAAFISVEVQGADRTHIEKSLQDGGLRFLFVSPEQMQRHEFREKVRLSASKGVLSSVVIDEVHCLSEWGHDFRTAYLTLGRTIKKYTSKTPILSLTATASTLVMEDISVELDIDDNAICYHMDRSRTELNFKVEKTSDELADVKNLIISLKNQDKVSQERPFLIFTPTVNKAEGCAGIIGHIRQVLKGERVALFSGSEPQKEKWQVDKDQSVLPEMDWQQIESLPADQRYGKYKAEVQRLFKQDKITGICATKSFGMGVNKDNIRTTVHLGCPQSMEALYQEAGRAGRDRKDAECLILFKPEAKPIPDYVLDPNTPVEKLSEWEASLKRAEKGDFTQQLWLSIQDLYRIDDELKKCTELIGLLRKNKLSKQTISDINNVKIEKIIYRLYQLGFITDWVVTDFRRGIYEVEWQDRSIEQISSKLKDFTARYSDDNLLGVRERATIDTLLKENKSTSAQESELIRYLLQWSYDQFVYNRRQSLHNVYKQCEDFESLGAERFRELLEAYFSSELSQHITPVLSANYVYAAKQIEILLTTKDGEIKDFETIQKLSAAISRLLEAQRDNVGLNLLSGVTSALLGDFDSANGRSRLQAYFEAVEEQEGFTRIAPGLIKLLGHFSKPVCDEICSELFKFDVGMDMEIDLYEKLGVEVAAFRAVERMNRTVAGMM